MKQLFILFLLLNTLFANDSNTTLKKMIGQMLIVGFNAENIDTNKTIIDDINRYHLGGVILFDKDYQTKKQKNITSPSQLKTLTHSLKQLSDHPIFIAIDQEGGKVARLKPAYGFNPSFSAKTIANMDDKDAKNSILLSAKMLHNYGINMNFSPVVDLAIEPKNKVIYQLQRSYGADPKKVAHYAAMVIDAQTHQHILSVAKHFPGHGSSLDDSHKGFVDITKSWSPQELLPYKILIEKQKLDLIMSAHVFNAHLDPHYPATLSYAINTTLLREKLHYHGALISDDMQMKAIANYYPLHKALMLAINSGIDLLLFGNQLDYINVKTIVETIYTLVEKNKISKARIIEANRRIANLHTRLEIIQKPIQFADTRKQLTQEYIQKHYNLHPKNITITPHIVVVHWTAIPTLQDSFKRMEKEKLSTQRKDIQKASLLNVSAHFLVDRDGTIYQLMPDNIMARHVIGLNYSSIGIENVGGYNNTKEDLTPAQLQANIRLIRYLKQKYPSITYLIGHYEYLQMQNNPLWLEQDPNYRTIKKDPGEKFMIQLRTHLRDLHLKHADQ